MTSAVTDDKGVSGTYFGTAITPMSFEQWLDEIGQRLQEQRLPEQHLHESQPREPGLQDQELQKQRRGWITGHHNLHSLYLTHTDQAVKAFYNRCNECYLDGVPLRCILSGMGIRTDASQRFSLMDRFEDLLLHASSKGWSLFYLGSNEAVVEKSRELLARSYPSLRIGLHPGYNINNEMVCHSINSFRPDILLVGMGMPGQEQWLNQHMSSLDVGMALQAGATLDYFAGAQARPPQWLSQLGLAWLYRLAHDPRRLWQRYLIEPWSLLLPTLRVCHDHRRYLRHKQRRNHRRDA